MSATTIRQEARTKQAAWAHDTAIVSDDAELGEGTLVWHFAHTERLSLDVQRREPLRVQLEQAIEYFSGGSRGLLCTAEDGLAAVALAERATILADEGYV